METHPPESLNLLTGPIMVGVIIGVFLNGIATVQSYIYFRSDSSRRDRLWLKVLVALVWIQETLIMLFSCIYLYYITITHFGQYSRIGDTPWSLSCFVILAALVSTVVQSFFAWRVHVISGHWFITVIAWIGGIVRVAIAFTISNLLAKETTLERFEEKYHYLFVLLLSLSVAIDMMITVSICYYLHTLRTGFTGTDAMVDQIMIWAIETGLITSICGVVMLIMEVSKPDWNIWVGILMFFPKLYSNAFFLSLNGRSLLRDCSNSVIQSSFNFKQGQSMQPAVHVTVENHSHTDTLEMGNLKVDVKRGGGY
ncbi:hypothetical protein C8J56DRAFT_823846 [Mycena floridula]|nr:hypothetical protein C8J56DRAFT_823846 [Mycena floridula]